MDLIGLETIRNIVSEIEQEYRACPGLFLSEDDVKCMLYKKIYEYIDRTPQGHLRPTVQERILASPLHAEIKYLDASGKLSIRPDITVLDPQCLSITESSGDIEIGRKGFVFHGSATAIEIKFCKSRTGINRRFVDRIRGDCAKLEEIKGRLFSENDASFKGAVVVFNRTSKKDASLNALLRDYEKNADINVFYATAEFNGQVGPTSP